MAGAVATHAQPSLDHPIQILLPKNEPAQVKREDTGQRPPVLLKSPYSFQYLTRGPGAFKRIYIQALFYSLRPLSFLDFEPTVQPSCFSALALRSFQFLCFSPRFLQKSPGNLVFLVEKPLDLVLGLVFAF